MSDLLARLREAGAVIRVVMRGESPMPNMALSGAIDILTDIERIVTEWERSQWSDLVPPDGGYRIVYACRKCARIGFGANECECGHGKMDRCALVPTVHLTRLVYMAGIRAVEKPAPPEVTL